MKILLFVGLSIFLRESLWAMENSLWEIYNEARMAQDRKNEKLALSNCCLKAGEKNVILTEQQFFALSQNFLSLQKDITNCAESMYTVECSPHDPAIVQDMLDFLSSEKWSSHVEDLRQDAAQKFLPIAFEYRCKPLSMLLLKRYINILSNNYISFLNSAEHRKTHNNFSDALQHKLVGGLMKMRPYLVSTMLQRSPVECTDLWSKDMGEISCKKGKKSLVVATGDTVACAQDNVVKVFSGNGKLVDKLVMSKGVRALFANFAGIAASSDSSIRLWQTTTRKYLKEISGYNKTAVALALDDKKKYLAVSYEDKIIHVYDTESGLLAADLKLDKKNKQCSFLRFIDQNRLVIGYDSGCHIDLWDISNNVVNLIGKEQNDITAIATSLPANAIVMGDRGGNMRIWNCEKGCNTHAWPAHDVELTAIGIENNFKHIGTGADNGEIKIWNTKNGSCIYKLAAYEGPVTSLEFNNKDQYLMALSFNNEFLPGKRFDVKSLFENERILQHGLSLNQAMLVVGLMEAQKSYIVKRLLQFTEKKWAQKLLEDLPISILVLAVDSGLLSSEQILQLGLDAKLKSYYAERLGALGDALQLS